MPNRPTEAQGPTADTETPTQPATEHPLDVIEQLFTYHAPSAEQAEKYLLIRNAAKALARIIDQCCPAGPDRTTAVRKVREAVMVANCSIATNNAYYR